MAFSPGCVEAWGGGFGARPLGGPVQLTARERQRRLVQAGGGSAHKALDSGSIPINDRGCLASTGNPGLTPASQQFPDVGKLASSRGPGKPSWRQNS